MWSILHFFGFVWCGCVVGWLLWWFLFLNRSFMLHCLAFVFVLVLFALFLAILWAFGCFVCGVVAVVVLVGQGFFKKNASRMLPSRSKFEKIFTRCLTRAGECGRVLVWRGRSLARASVNRRWRRSADWAWFCLIILARWCLILVGVETKDLANSGECWDFWSWHFFAFWW